MSLRERLINLNCFCCGRPGQGHDLFARPLVSPRRMAISVGHVGISQRVVRIQLDCLFKQAYGFRGRGRFCYEKPP